MKEIAKRNLGFPPEKIKRINDKISIKCILGVNCLYKPMPESNMVYKSEKPQYPVTFLIPKTDSETLNKVRKFFMKHAENAWPGNKENIRYLLDVVKTKKFYDGDDSDYDNEHGNFILKTTCYEERPATGEIIGDTVKAERVNKDDEGIIRAGDKVMACLNIYYNARHCSLQVKVYAVYLLEKGEGSGDVANIRLRHEKALKELGLTPATDGEEEEIGDDWDDLKSAEAETDQSEVEELPEESQEDLTDDWEEPETPKPVVKKVSKKAVKKVTKKVARKVKAQPKKDESSTEW